MRILQVVAPSPEQLPIIAESRPGFRVIRGAAGSGKTTTALLRLKALCASRLERQQRLGLTDPVRVMVQTYNKTLEGYITELARSQVTSGPGLVLEVTTFSKWAVHLTGHNNILDRDGAKPFLNRRLASFTADPKLRDFYMDEIEYVLGRLAPTELEEYLTMNRKDRGQSPRVDQTLRRRLLDEVIFPYQEAKRDKGLLDWNDLAFTAASARTSRRYDVVIIDEAQDFSAHQIRAVVSHLAQDHSTTFVLDAVQRIYPRSFQWNEVGVDKPSFSRLGTNYRNTAEIAAFALPLVAGLPTDDDGSLPDFLACRESGQKPKVISGTYSSQLAFMLDELVRDVDLTTESVAIMQPSGGKWFDYARSLLAARGIPFVELTRNSNWPRGAEQVGLTTISSAKGLEFDHVLLPGLNQKVTPHGTEDGDAALERLRRLLAMGIGRARKSVMVGYKEDERSSLIGLLDPSTFDKVTL